MYTFLSLATQPSPLPGILPPNGKFSDILRLSMWLQKLLYHLRWEVYRVSEKKAVREWERERQGEAKHKMSLMRHWKNVKNIISFSFFEAKVRQVFFNWIQLFSFFCLPHDDEEMHLRSTLKKREERRKIRSLDDHLRDSFIPFSEKCCCYPHHTGMNVHREMDALLLERWKIKIIYSIGDAHKSKKNWVSESWAPSTKEM